MTTIPACSCREWFCSRSHVVIEHFGWKDVQSDWNRGNLILPPNLTYQVIDHPDDTNTAAAISTLLKSMRDPILAVDFEWRFDLPPPTLPKDSAQRNNNNNNNNGGRSNGGRRGKRRRNERPPSEEEEDTRLPHPPPFHPSSSSSFSLPPWHKDGIPSHKIALVQIASSSHCLLLRTCHSNYNLPPPVLHLLLDPTMILIGCGTECDKTKIQLSFNIDPIRLGLIDIQEVGERFGYQQRGLAWLSEKMLGFRNEMTGRDGAKRTNALHCSDWEASRLSEAQIVVAASDALLAGHVYRALRQLHASKQPCVRCARPLGSLSLDIRLYCPIPHCGRGFLQVSGLEQHVKSQHATSGGGGGGGGGGGENTGMSQVVRVANCESCHRVWNGPDQVKLRVVRMEEWEREEGIEGLMRLGEEAKERTESITHMMHGTILHKGRLM